MTIKFAQKLYLIDNKCNIATRKLLANKKGTENIRNEHEYLIDVLLGSEKKKKERINVGKIATGFF